MFLRLSIPPTREFPNLPSVQTHAQAHYCPCYYNYAITCLFFFLYSAENSVPDCKSHHEMIDTICNSLSAITVMHAVKILTKYVIASSNKWNAIYYGVIHYISGYIHRFIG